MSWTRRVFLKETITNWLGLVVGPSAYALMCRSLYRPNASTPREIVIGKLDQFAPKSSKIVYLGSEKVIVGRSSDGSFHAVSAVCTHLGCSIRFDAPDSQEEFACNCHASRFDLGGLNLSGPATTPLRHFGIKIVGEDLILSVERKAGDHKTEEPWLPRRGHFTLEDGGGRRARRTLHNDDVG